MRLRDFLGHTVVSPLGRSNSSLNRKWCQEYDNKCSNMFCKPHVLENDFSEHEVDNSLKCSISDYSVILLDNVIYNQFSLAGARTR